MFETCIKHHHFLEWKQQNFLDKMSNADERLQRMNEEKSIDMFRRQEADVIRQVQRDNVYQHKGYLQEENKQDILKRLNKKFKNAEIQQLLNIYWVRQKRDESAKRQQMRQELQQEIKQQNRLNIEMERERQTADYMRFDNWKEEKDYHIANKKILRDEMTRMRHDIKNLFTQISVSTGNNSLKLNKKLQKRILQFKEISQNFENLNIMQTKRSHNNQDSRLTGNTNLSQSNIHSAYNTFTSKNNWVHSTKKLDKNRSESKTTADNSRNGGFSTFNSSAKKNNLKGQGKIRDNREKVGKQMHKLKKKDNQLIMNLLQEQEMQ